MHHFPGGFSAAYCSWATALKCAYVGAPVLTLHSSHLSGEVFVVMHFP